MIEFNLCLGVFSHVFSKSDCSKTDKCVKIFDMLFLTQKLNIVSKNSYVSGFMIFSTFSNFYSIYYLQLV